MPESNNVNCVTFENIGSFPVSNIYCVGRNYAKHAKELGNAPPKERPIIFLKTSSSLRGLEPQPIGFKDDFFHHEIELVLYVGSPLALGAKGDWTHIEGIALGIDLTRREEQSQLKASGLPWTTAKSFAGSAIVSPFLAKSVWTPQRSFSFSLAINDQVDRQVGDTNDMIFDVPEILTYLASFNELKRGDLIFTGTPEGVGPVKKGDRMTLKLLSPSRTWHGKL
jgi:2-keto-4-pentenoate hydratase/2-oxohepta-3-ene-1,7-dioic acid hydratase in catechol pathway